MKKEVNLILRTYRAILTDCYVSVGLSENDFSQSLTQIETLVNTRGVRVVYQDFPNAAKLFDRSLSTGYASLDELRKTFGSLPKTNLPRIFHHLWVMIYTEEGVLVNDPDPNVVLFIRQLLLMFKKIHRDCSEKATTDSLVEFKTLDEEVSEGIFPVWEDPLDLSYPVPKRRSRSNESVEFDFYSKKSDRLSTLMRIAEKVGYHDYTPDELMFKRWITSFADAFAFVTCNFSLLHTMDLIPSHGTGAVAGMPWGDKFSFPFWSDKLSTVFPLEDFAALNYASIKDLNGKFARRDIPVEIIPVPKTLKGPRIIGTECASRMYCQQAVRHWLKDQIRPATFGSVDIRSQARSQAFALKGSIDGSYATIDLSSASDRLSCSLVEELFASNMSVLQALAASRATYYTIELPSGKTISGKMRKFSHQGSAVTFPVQSLAYYAICIAVWHWHRNIPVRYETVREASQHITVYGDDIIVPTDIYEPTIQALEEWGLKVNVGKSHGETSPRGDSFRESCGVDAFNGIDVTPTYIRDFTYEVQKPESVIRFVEVGNNLHKAGYWNASTTLFSPSGISIPTTDDEQVPLAYYTFTSGISTTGLRTRWNKQLHRREVRSLVPTTVGTKKERGGSESILQYILESPSPTTTWKAGYYKKRPKPRFRSKWIHSDRL